ncbi:phosphoribosyl 1,2-cyclic phosphate 1,2-diphosphodiesterase [Anaerolineae bacterium]|nr:phosphoribosyl 1,2-cyclic phosphate 1,2-diphosphodiesterase [Anaerolineae bacterium]
MRIDLHTHSSASDGELTPDALVQFALERGMATIALTDHDTIAGLDAAIAAAQGTTLEVIPGVELSADVDKAEAHVLGYFVDWHDAHFLAMLEKFREGRYGRAEKMVKKLTALGAPISFARVKEIAGDAALGRPHVAQALLEAGHIATIVEAFDKYIGRNGPAYVERFRLTPEDAVALILQAGGVPVLAHPREVSYWVQPLVKAGLLGLEVYYGMYDDQTRAQLARLAKQYGLIATGGSDFHGMNKMAHMCALGDVDVPPGAADKLREKAKQVKEENTASQ